MTRSFLTFILGVYLMSMAPAAYSAQAPVQLPDGEGKPLVQGLCATCHELNLIPRSSGYTRAGWRELIGNMINIAGTPAEDAITQYLATHFPPNTNLQPKLIPGPVSISFREWKVPQLGQRARDPV
jgi:virginiamycin B lyase